MFKQARWNEPLIFNLGKAGRVGYSLPKVEDTVKKAVGDLNTLIPENMQRKKAPKLPELSEPEVVRHYMRLSEMNYGVDSGFYPLGSCTMKYNPKINETLASLPTIGMIHPYQDGSTVQGILEILYRLEGWLAELTGTDEVCLQPAAGAHGEFLGALIIRAYHKFNGEADKRREMLIPDSAHGTNPASAAMAGFNVVVVPSDEDGCVDVEALKAAVSEKTAGLMLTNPNTLGVFEKNIEEIAKIIHEAGGLLYYDGANLNPLLCKVRPGDMGFDIVHINIHKTFSTPHGGGGPGAGPVGVTRELCKFLP
ncbi:MAG: aminomethyl-transferring glycine dehydrogenase subunit GcvPB, partial [Candidatus Bathyarchaeia archaeon]